MSRLWWLALAGGAVSAALLWRYGRGVYHRAQLSRAKRRFHTERERLEAKFLRLAAAHAPQDSARWSECNFADDVVYVRDRTTGRLSALVEVTLGEEMFSSEGQGATDAVGNLLVGTAIFRFDHGHWETDGRAILNLNPVEAVKRFRDSLEPISAETGRQHFWGKD